MSSVLQPPPKKRKVQLEEKEEPEEFSSLGESEDESTMKEHKEARKDDDKNDTKKMNHVKEIKLIACDMDGTFLDPEHEIREENLQAVREVRKRNVEFIIVRDSPASISNSISRSNDTQATGRNQQSAQDIAGKKFSVKDNYGVFLNGALAYRDDGSLLFERTVSNELAKELLLFVRDRESMSINLCSYDKFYAMSLDRKYDLHLHEKYDDPKPSLMDKKKILSTSLHMIHVRSCLSGNKLKTTVNIPKQQTLRTQVLGDPESIDKIWPHVEQMCKKHGATLARNLPTDIAITHPNATKGVAVSEICKLKKLDIGKHVCAIGDSGNDVSMVSAARLGVAMGNARSELKAVADFVTSRNDDRKEPGVARVLNAIARRDIVIYEVNIEVDEEIAQKYVAWLVPHMKEMLTIPGFIDCTLADVEHLSSESENLKKKYMVATYRVESREMLQQYFDVHAARLRGDGVNRFKGRFSCTRRIHSNLLVA